MRTTRFSILLLCVLALGGGTVWLAGCGDSTKSAEAACT